MRHWGWIFSSLVLMSMVSAETIEEKLASSSGLSELSASGIEQFNAEVVKLKEQLSEKYFLADTLHQSGAKEEAFLPLVEEVKAVRSQIDLLEKRWHDSISSEMSRDQEGYALWDQEEMTLQQLVLEYGPNDSLYLIPPEIAALKVYIHASIPIPKESWKDVLEILLVQNGIGTKNLNSYTKQLYLLKQEPFSLQNVVDQSRVFYVFSPPPEQVRSVVQFFEKFIDSKISLISQIGTKIAVISSKEEIFKLLDLYQAVWQEGQGKVSRVIAVNKMPVKEMERILQAFFGDAFEKPKSPFAKNEQEGLHVISPSIGNVLVLIGNEEVVKRAEKIVTETMDQLQDPAEMTVFLYSCRHSNPEDLSKVLEKVYGSLLSTADLAQDNLEANYSSRGTLLPSPDGYAPVPPLTVPSPSFRPEVSTRLEVEQGMDHFIPDVKTGNLLMVVRRNALAKIKDILRKLDVPKRMVQIEVLLFEKKINSQSNLGLNLLKIGSNHNGARYDGPNVPPPEGLKKPVGEGVLEFIFSGRKSKHFPAFDLAYSFLMTQEDLQLNAAPSVITINQTPATISVLEEISINNGAAPVDTNKGTTFEKAFSRAQYGATIIVTPIIHLPDNPEDILEGKGFITLQTNITFDTTKPSLDDRPTVDRRHIENEVRVVDGQTVILGGLRKKSTQDHQDKVPFLGEIPGLGKLFGSSNLIDNNSEMFIFITPKIVQDPREELDYIRTEELKKRPGDLPEFLQKIIEAKDRERKKFFAQTMNLLFRNQ